VPLPIFVAAFIAVERLLRIDFDPVLVPVSYANKAVAGIRSRLSEFTIESGGSPETPSRLRPPNWGDRELHPGSRRLVRSRRQPGRNVYARTLPGGHVHRAARKAGAAGNAASGHA